MKQSLKLRKLIDETIKIGDEVRIIDGSGLSSIENPYDDFYIIYPYEDLTKDARILKNIDSIVLEVNINDRVIEGSVDNAYLQDVIIKIGEATFRTCSQFVKKI